jgi:hypothetical protein
LDIPLQETYATVYRKGKKTPHVLPECSLPHLQP